MQRYCGISIICSDRELSLLLERPGYLHAHAGIVRRSTMLEATHAVWACGLENMAIGESGHPTIY